jgi:prepilin-type N-terminal cleavage/methylation domain-containing protein
MKSKQGMTLVEVVVASTIFMIFCAGFYAVYI